MNRLAHESSPYLQQHQSNPVDWYPWGEEALARARAEDKPILLSIGYSACHWCHVMAHESFEDPVTAELMNRLYVNIKVDREERPDLDAIYMDAVTAMTGHGGWPMTVFLDPHGLPLYGGTYYPPEPRYGMPSFRMVLEGVAAAYAQDRDALVSQGEQLLAHIARRSQLAAREGELGRGILDRAQSQLVRQADLQWGGFSSSGPKFPQPMVLEALLRLAVQSGDAAARRVLELTLSRMAQGGMYDQLGGGFARYSVDERWQVPHFEKMLYDNAQLATLYLHAWQAYGTPTWRRIAEETLEYLKREMLDPSGGFYSSQDADSEGEEGRFFVWTPEEIRALLPADEATALMAAYDVTPGGNFEGQNVLWMPRPLAEVARGLALSEAELEARLARARATLVKARARRIAPGTDTKILTAWNALALSAFAEASLAFGRADYLAIAERTADFLLGTLRSDEGRLLRTWRAGSQARLDGYLEDYAYLADALLTLYEVSLNRRWLDEAEALTEAMLDDFSDPQGGFFDTGAHHESLIVRPKEVADNAVPSGNAMAARLLLRLAAYRDEPRYRESAERTLRLVGPAMGEQPLAFGHWLVALTFALTPTAEVVLIGAREATLPFLAPIGARFLPHRVVLQAAPDEVEALAARFPLLAGRTALDGQATAYLCFNHACQQPVTSVTALGEQVAAI